MPKFTLRGWVFWGFGGGSSGGEPSLCFLYAGPILIFPPAAPCRNVHTIVVQVVACHEQDSRPCCAPSSNAAQLSRGTQRNIKGRKYHLFQMLGTVRIQVASAHLLKKHSTSHTLDPYDRCGSIWRWMFVVALGTGMRCKSGGKQGESFCALPS